MLITFQLTSECHHHGQLGHSDQLIPVVLPHHHPTLPLRCCSSRVNLWGKPQSPAPSPTRLSLTPDIVTFEELLGQTTLANSTTDGLLLVSQYQGVIVQAVAAAAGLEMPEAAEELFHELAASNTSIIHDEELRSEALSHMYELFVDAFADTVKEALEAILWLYPAAVSSVDDVADEKGAVLILCALRSAVRYHFEGRSHYLIHGLWIVTGLAVAVLGVLDIGSPKVIDTHDVATALGQDVQVAPHERPVNVLHGSNW